MKIKITKKIVDSWSSYKNKYNKPGKLSYNADSEILGHKLFWTCPDDVLWLYCTGNQESYEGNQTQFGVKIDGTIVWGYFSHCSCYGYEDCRGDYKKLDEENEIHSEKHYEMEGVDTGVLEIIKSRLKEVSKKGLKDN